MKVHQVPASLHKKNAYQHYVAWYLWSWEGDFFYFYLSEWGEIKFFGGGWGVGDRYVFGCIFCCKFWNIFPLHLPYITSPHPPPGREGVGRGVGDRYVFVCICLQILEHFSSTPTLHHFPPPPHLGGRGWGRGVGDRYVFVCICLQILEHFSSTHNLPSLPPTPHLGEGVWR